MVAALDIEALLSRLGSHLRLVHESEPPRILPLEWPELAAALPDGGLPKGGVIELAAPGCLGGSTSVAMAAVRAGQTGKGQERSWCAWVDPEATLHGPGLVTAGVDLSRLFVVQPPRALLGKVAVKLVGSGAFAVVVIDIDPITSASASLEPVRSVASKRAHGWAPEVLVRKLALAAESAGTTVLLLTDASRPHATQWPVALRLELSRPDAASLAVRVGKDRRGRVGLQRVVPFLPVSAASGF